MGDLRDAEVFAAKLRNLALDGSKRFDGFQYNVEDDIQKYVDIAKRVSIWRRPAFHACSPAVRQLNLLQAGLSPPAESAASRHCLPLNLHGSACAGCLPG